MTRSHHSAAIVVAVILLVAGAHAISDKEGKQIAAIFAEHPNLSSVMRRVIAAIETNGKRGLLQTNNELCVTFGGAEGCDEVGA